MIFHTNLQAIEGLLGPIAGKSLLDIGCGRGRLCRALSKRGAEMTGVDPQEAILALAKETDPTASFVPGGAESLPFDDNSFDGAIILNSLHHIPAEAIPSALAEAFRVVRPDATFLILEPLAHGGYHEVFAPIDDETEVRAEALTLLDRFIEESGADVVFRGDFNTMVPEASAADVLAGAIRVDPTRAEIVERAAEEVTRLFAIHVQLTDRGPALEQPMIAVALRKAP